MGVQAKCRNINFPEDVQYRQSSIIVHRQKGMKIFLCHCNKLVVCRRRGELMVVKR